MWFFPLLLLSSSWDQCLFRQKKPTCDFFPSRRAAPLPLPLPKRQKKGRRMVSEGGGGGTSRRINHARWRQNASSSSYFCFSLFERRRAPSASSLSFLFFSVEGKASCQKIRTRKEGIVYLELLSAQCKKLFLRFEVKNTSALY